MDLNVLDDIFYLLPNDILLDRQFQMMRQVLRGFIKKDIDVVVTKIHVNDDLFNRILDEEIRKKCIVNDNEYFYLSFSICGENKNYILTVKDLGEVVYVSLDINDKLSYGVDTINLYVGETHDIVEFIGHSVEHYDVSVYSKDGLEQLWCQEDIDANLYGMPSAVYGNIRKNAKNYQEFINSEFSSPVFMECFKDEIFLQADSIVRDGESFFAQLFNIVGAGDVIISTSFYNSIYDYVRGLNISESSGFILKREDEGYTLFGIYTDFTQVVYTRQTIDNEQAFNLFKKNYKNLNNWSLNDFFRDGMNRS